MNIAKPFRALYAHILLVIFFSQTCLAVHQESNLQLILPEQNKTYSAIAKQYLPSVANLEEQEKKKAEDAAHHNTELLTNRKQELFPVDINKIAFESLGPVEKTKLVYQLFGMLPPDKASEGQQGAENIYHDLEIFCGYAPTLEHHLFSLLDHTQTTFGKVELQKILFQPTTHIPTLTARQKIIQALLQDEKLLEQLDQHLAAIKDAEATFLTFYKKASEALALLFEQVYFQSHWYGDLTDWNKKNIPLEVPVLWNTIINPSIIPISAAIAAYRYRNNLAQIWKAMKEDSAVRSLILFAGAFYGAYFGFIQYAITKHAININNLTNFIQSQMISIATLSKAMKNLSTALSPNTPLRDLLNIDMLALKNNEQTEELQDLRATLESNTFKGKASFFSHKGKALASFKIMEEIKDDFIKGLQVVGQIDAYVALAKLYKKMATHENVHFCFASYETAAQPHITATNYWHPFLNPDRVVTNSIEIGGTQQPNNIILTGPNAAGKSTTLKALTISLWFAFTTTIVPAESFACTPFKLINTYLNIADTEGRESLFQAEMHRAQALINSLKVLKPNEFSFVIMDEIFTGTNPEEGQAGAYGIAKYLATFPNSCCIVATHYKKLTELAEATQGCYKNYKVYVIKNANGTFTYPYKIEPGITDQAIALDLLGQEGFNWSILQSAQQAFNDIQAAKKDVAA